jgi:signal transduction histidine kinase
MSDSSISGTGFFAYRKAQKQPSIEEKAKFYKKLIDSIPDIVLVLDRNGAIQYHNSQFELHFGHKVRRGTSVVQLAGDNESKKAFETLLTSLKAGTTGKALVAIHFGDEKTFQKFEVAGSYLDNYLLMTLRSRFDDEIIDLMRIHADRIETIQNVNSQLSHELRSPLTVVKLGAEFIIKLTKQFKERTVGTDVVRKELCEKLCERLTRTAQETLDQTEYTIGILKNLSAYSKLGQVEEEVIDVGETLEITLNIIKKASKIKDLSESQLVVNLKGLYSIRVYMNKMWLSQIIWNLCTNAYEAIEPNGKIWVTGTAKGDQVYIRILNTGSIDEDMLEKIFTPRFTTKPGSQGLGLAIVRNIVFKSGGHVWASNYKEKGLAVLTVRLPIYRDQETLDTLDCDSTTHVLTLSLSELEDLHETN